jgi:hypothetical protein
MLAEEEREALVGSTLGVSRRWGARCHHVRLMAVALTVVVAAAFLKCWL